MKKVSEKGWTGYDFKDKFNIEIFLKNFKNSFKIKF